MEGFTNHLVGVTIPCLAGHRNSALDTDYCHEKHNAESVGEFQPRVALRQPWEQARSLIDTATLKGVAEPARAQPFRVAKDAFPMSMTQGFKANPGLEFANAFCVIKRRGSNDISKSDSALTCTGDSERLPNPTQP
jgi:hypothetical protein